MTTTAPITKTPTCPGPVTDHREQEEDGGDAGQGGDELVHVAPGRAVDRQPAGDRGRGVGPPPRMRRTPLPPRPTAQASRIAPSAGPASSGIVPALSAGSPPAVAGAGAWSAVAPAALAAPTEASSAARSRACPVRRRGGRARQAEGEVAGERNHRQGVDDQRRDQERVADVAQGNVDGHAIHSPSCRCGACCCAGWVGCAGWADGTRAACSCADLSSAASAANSASKPPPASVRASPPTCTVVPTR